MLKDREETLRNVRLTLEEKIHDLLKVMDIQASGLTIGEAWGIGRGIWQVTNAARNVTKGVSNYERD